MTAKEMLDQLVKLRVARDKQAEPFSSRITALTAIMNDITEEANAEISALEKTIKETVLVAGLSIRGTDLQAVHRRGPVIWNTEALDGYAIANKDVLKFRSTGKASVSIRAIPAKKK